MRISSVNYGLTVRGIYGSSGLLDWVLKRDIIQYSLKNSLNSNSNIDFYFRIYKLSMSILQLNNERIFNLIIAPNYKIFAGFFYVLLISFYSTNNLTQNTILVVLINTLTIPEFSI